jgi:hypothetical protein
MEKEKIRQHISIVRIVREEKMFWRSTRERIVPYNRRGAVIPKNVLLGLDDIKIRDEREKALVTKKVSSKRHNRRSSTISKDILLKMIRDSGVMDSNVKENSTACTKLNHVEQPSAVVDTVSDTIPSVRRTRRASSSISAA